MKTILPLICFTLASVGLATSPATAQIVNGSLPPGIQAGGQGGVTPFQSAIATTWPGRYWFGVNLADNGFGYSGSYASLGLKRRLFDDYFDGRWVGEARGHVSLDRGGLFGNVGVERVFTIEAAGADIAFGAWYDHDADQPGNFAFTLDQVAFSAAIKTQNYDVYGNGYLPIGDRNHSLGDPTGENVFFRNNIVIQPGIDSALEGWDAQYRVRPTAMAMVHGSAEIGVYQFKSDLVESFVGVRTRFGMQAPQGMTVNLEMNYDERFDFTAGLTLGWIFGGQGPSAEYAGQGRDLEKSGRPDHITRYQQDLVLALDPQTGEPIVVWHVDNSAALGGIGSYESRFSTLAEAQAASGLGNIIFVHDGDGTTTGLASGIVLKDRQQLLGDGVSHTIAVQNGNLFTFSNDLDGVRPTISNLNASAVTLADRNTVRGFVIDGTGNNMTHGITGDGAGGTVSDGVIEDVAIVGTPVIHGINLNMISGDWTFSRNNISTATNNGINIQNTADNSSRFTFDSNVVSGNGQDGISFNNWDGRRVLFSNNTTSGNGRDGVRMTNYAGGNLNIDFNSHTANNNATNGITFNGGTGDFTMRDSTITGNNGNGLSIQNFMNAANDDTMIIDSVFTGNGTGGGAGIEIIQTAGNQTVTMSGLTIDGNGIGVAATSQNVGTTLNLNIIDSVSISNNTADAIRVASRTGSTANFNFMNSGAALNMANNGGNGGLGIALFAEDGGANISILNATIDNINMTGTGAGNVASGLFGSAQGAAQLNTTITNSTFANGVGGNSVMFDFDANAGAISTVRIIDSTVTGSGVDAINFNNAAASQVDIVLQNLTLTGGSRGVNIATSGTSMTRLFADNNNISGMTFDGINLTSIDTAQVLGTIQNNTITGNGPGADPTMDPYFDGINISAGGASRQSLSILNNAMTGNNEFGLDLQTLGTGRIDAVMAGNAIANNDIGAASAGANDFQAVNAAGGTLCLAMTTNFFALSANVVNNAAPGFFTVELDGNTNGPGVPNFVGGQAGFNVVPFGTTCQPAINAQAAVFAGAGFP